LALREWGSGPAVLLIHGWCGIKEAWGPLPEALAAAGMRVVAVDLPGWGETPALGRRRHSAEDYAGALAPLASRLGASALVGHSMGCQPALLLAARLQAVRALVLLAPPAVRVDRIALPPRSLTELVSLPAIGLPATRLALLALKLGRPAPAVRYRRTVADLATLEVPEAAAVLRSVDRAFLRTPTATMARSLRSVARTDLRAAARRVPQPTLIVVGERDLIVHPAESHSLARALPDPRLVRVPDCGHLPHHERPEVVVPEIVRHVRGWGPDVPEAQPGG
jgi:pimeloyl-ACP methyl ester carboxylesterase